MQDLSNLRYVRRLLLLAILALAAALLAPLAANARVVPHKSIGQVRLGLSESKLRDRISQPDRVVRTTGIISGLPTTIWELKGLEIEFEGANTVTKITTTRVFERTKKGVGVGTPKRLVRKLHPAFRCGKGKTTTCRLSRNTKKVSKGTWFEIANGRVASITMWRYVAQSP